MRHNDGQAIILVVMIIAILYVLTASLGSLTGHSYKNIISEQQFVQALYAADAGIENTIARVLNDSAWYAGLTTVFTTVFNQEELTSGVLYTAKIKKVSNSKQLFGTAAMIEAVGQCASDGKIKAQKTLQANIAVYTAGDFFKGWTILPQENGGVAVTGSALINSPVICRGDLTLGGSLTVAAGNPVYTGGKLTLMDNAACEAGNVYENYPYIPSYPDINTDYYQNLAGKSGAEHLFTSGVSNPNFTFPNSHIDTKQVLISGSVGAEATVYMYSDCYYVDGDLSISGPYQGKAVIFAAGDINIDGDLISVNDNYEEAVEAGNLTLVALGDIVAEDSKVHANLMARGLFKTQGAVTLQGAVCASGVDVGQGHFELIFNNIDVDQTAIPVSLKVLNWKELYPVIAGAIDTVVMCNDEKFSG